jgi:hypothetical protein
MSELMNTLYGPTNLRWQLLAGVSATALVAFLSTSGVSYAADDTDHPFAWIELGGQLEHLTKSEEPFVPSFVANLPSNFFSPLNVQKPLQYSIDGEGSISFEPQGTNWVFAVSVQFGRSKAAKREHQQTPNAKVPVAFTFPFPPPYNKYYGGFDMYPTNFKFEGANAKRSETHTVLDFQAGKDVGFGLFGNRGTSIVSAGVRFAQFTAQSQISMGAAPDINYPGTPINSFTAYKQFKYHHYTQTHHHFYSAMLNSQRRFHGIGPSVSWKGSMPVLGLAEHGEIAFDWGLNGAVLFGRQRASGQHHETTRTDYVSGRFISERPGAGGPKAERIGRWPVVRYNLEHSAADFNRVRSVMVPNFGGLAGISFRYADAKVSFGYRADFFFGAMDGGIDAARKENQGFYGPFASVSVGIGG